MKVLPAIVVFIGSFFAFAFLFVAAPVIPDADSYYHLAVAREYATQGYLDALPWARFSILGDTFGDKELLFHVLLAPFTRGDAANGGRLALALLNATVAAVVALFASRAFGWWSVVVPAWLYLAAPMLTFRLIRLRPEILALLLIIVLIHRASARRYLGVAMLTAVFALSYTAFQVVIGLSLFFFLATIREKEWRLPLAATIGVTVGLLVHPGFPGNLRVWWAQNVLFFLEKSSLDVGNEIDAPSIEVFFIRNLGWWAGLLLLFVFTRNEPADRRRFVFFGIAAGLFAILAVLMERMAVYFVPLLTLLLLERMASRPPVRIGRFAVALLATAIFSAPETVRMYGELMRGSGVDLTYESDYAELGRVIPRGAKVAAHWGPTEFFTFWAPQGRYLNVLDPIFMAAIHPNLYQAQRRLFDGEDVDVPRTVKHILDSDYIAFNAATPLYDRVEHDPRVVALYVGFSFLGRIVPEETRRFVRDWRLGSGQQYRLVHTSEAYIDARRLSRDQCVIVFHDERVHADVTRVYELAPIGRAELRIGETLLLRTQGASKAILGRGTMGRVTLAPGTHRFAVTTCAGQAGQNGFYLLLRSEILAPSP